MMKLDPNFRTWHRWRKVQRELVLVWIWILGFQYGTIRIYAMKGQLVLLTNEMLYYINNKLTKMLL